MVRQGSPRYAEIFATVGYCVGGSVLLALQPKGAKEWRASTNHSYKTIENAKAHWLNVPDVRGPSLRHDIEGVKPRGYTGH